MLMRALVSGEDEDQQLPPHIVAQQKSHVYFQADDVGFVLDCLAEGSQPIT